LTSPATGRIIAAYCLSEEADVRRLALAPLVALVAVAAGPATPGIGAPQSTVRDTVEAHLNPHLKHISAGFEMWLHPPAPGEEGPHPRQPSISFGSNVDAADPVEDLSGTQSETAIAAATMRGHRRVVVGWNDATGIFVAPTTRIRSSITGVGYSRDGGQSFRDLFGLPNDNRDQQWSGDPAVVAIDGGRHFIVGSLYYPSFDACLDGRPSQLTIAVSVGTPTPTGNMRFTRPIPVADAGDVCTFGPDTAALDKDWLAWDQASRTLAVSYTRFRFSEEASGLGQIEVVRAHVPENTAQLGPGAFGAPAVIWPEEQRVVNTGAYVTLARGGDAYVAWERNIDSNEFNGNPYIWENAAKLPAGANHPSVGGPTHRIVVTRGEINATPSGGVRSMSLEAIAGYNRFLGNDFPRIAWDRAHDRVLVQWNDSNLHPLGDIWLRALDANLHPIGGVHRLNDDSDFTLHFLPALTVHADGTICSGWYDRRRFTPDSARTDLFGECRGRPRRNGADFRITTGATDWTNTSSLLAPNFGDYTDATSDGDRTYYTWSDGRLGVPQPFVDHH
jgi:hypothetical protein